MIAIGLVCALAAFQQVTPVTHSSSRRAVLGAASAAAAAIPQIALADSIEDIAARSNKQAEAAAKNRVESEASAAEIKQIVDPALNIGVMCTRVRTSLLLLLRPSGSRTHLARRCWPRGGPLTRSMLHATGRLAASGSSSSAPSEPIWRRCSSAGRSLDLWGFATALPRLSPCWLTPRGRRTDTSVRRSKRTSTARTPSALAASRRTRDSIVPRLEKSLSRRRPSRRSGARCARGACESFRSRTHTSQEGAGRAPR